MLCGNWMLIFVRDTLCIWVLCRVCTLCRSCTATDWGGGYYDNIIIIIYLFQCNEVGGSAYMEKEGLIRSVNFLNNRGLSIETMVTDRHPQVQKWIRENLTHTKHYYDVRHVAKGSHIFSSAWPCQQSSWNRNSSIIRPCVASIISEPIAWILLFSFKFWFMLSLAHMPTKVLKKKIIFGFFSSAWLCQQSYCHGAGVRRPSVVRKLRFLWNRCMDPDQILWVAPFPPYLQTIFFLFLKFSIFKFLRIFFVFVNMGPYGSKNFKTLLLQFSSDLSQTLS